MSVLIAMAIAVSIVITVATTYYLGKKGWHALHQAVGITPGVLTYQDDDLPLSLSDISWQQLTPPKAHLSALSESQLRQLKRIDEKANSHQAHHTAQNSKQHANHTSHYISKCTEGAFVLHKLLHTRLPEALESHYLAHTHPSSNGRYHQYSKAANVLLQQVFDQIENRLDDVLAQGQVQQLQALQVMKNYIDSHNG